MVEYNGADPKEVEWAMQELRNQTLDHILLGERPDLTIGEDGVIIKKDTGLPYYGTSVPQGWFGKLLKKIGLRR